jgi:hypothetical protein
MPGIHRVCFKQTADAPLLHTYLSSNAILSVPQAGLCRLLEADSEEVYLGLPGLRFSFVSGSILTSADAKLMNLHETSRCGFNPARVRCLSAQQTDVVYSATHEIISSCTEKSVSLSRERKRCARPGGGNLPLIRPLL